MEKISKLRSKRVEKKYLNHQNQVNKSVKDDLKELLDAYKIEIKSEQMKILKKMNDIGHSYAHVRLLHSKRVKNLDKLHSKLVEKVLKCVLNFRYLKLRSYFL